MGFTISKNQGSGRTVITVTPEEKNATDKDIVQILTVEAVDGSTKEVKLIHKKGEGNYEYTFRVSPTELYFEPTGESKEVTIVSTKQMVINGKKVGDPVNVNYTRENSGDVSGSGTTLIMSLNDNTHKITFKKEKWGDNANNRPFPNHTNPDSGYSADTQVTGGGSPHENRPPYYVLAYVMKIR